MIVQAPPTFMGFSFLPWLHWFPYVKGVFIQFFINKVHTCRQQRPALNLYMAAQSSSNLIIWCGAATFYSPNQWFSQRKGRGCADPRGTAKAFSGSAKQSHNMRFCCMTCAFILSPCRTSYNIGFLHSKVVMRKSETHKRQGVDVWVTFTWKSELFDIMTCFSIKASPKKQALKKITPSSREEPWGDAEQMEMA